MKNIDSIGHVTGRSVFTDDIPLTNGTLFGVVVASGIAHGAIKSIDFSQALEMPGVVRILTCTDIPGENQIGGILPDETLFAEKEVHFIGQPIALIIADSEFNARRARKKIHIEYDEFEAVTDPRVAKEKRLLLFPPRTFALGNVAEAWQKCNYIFEGSADSGSQEHLYLETQNAYAVHAENGVW